MKKLVLIAMLLVSGLAYAAKPTEEQFSAFYKALASANARQIAEDMQQHAEFKTTTWQGGHNPFNVVLNASIKSDEPDNRIAALAVLIVNEYKVTEADLKLCFVKQHEAILKALTKMVKIAANKELVKAILAQKADNGEYAHWTPEFRKELIDNLAQMSPDTLLTALLSDQKNDSIVKSLVNNGIVVSDTVKTIIPAEIEKPENTSEKIPNPRLDVLKKDVDIAATSIVNGEAKTVLGISAGFIIALVIWKKYKKEIKAFFGDEEIEEALSKK
jgi:hypothetical protein